MSATTVKLAKSNWAEDWEEIANLDSSYERGITNLYAKELSDGWHYAIVFWRWKNPTVLVELLNGEAIYDRTS